MPHSLWTDIALVALSVSVALALSLLVVGRQSRRRLAEREARATEIKEHALRALDLALHEADASRRSRDEFLARMSHELRTPLNAIIGFSRVLERNRPGNQRAADLEMLSRIRANGEQLLRLVDEVMEHTRAEGELPADFKAMETDGILWRVLGDLPANIERQSELRL